MKIINKNELKISSSLFEFINNEAIPGTKIESEDFWAKFSKFVHELAPLNKDLIKKREIIQQKIDQWHKSNQGKEINKKEYLEFKKKVIKNVNDMYINAEHSKSKKSTTVRQHIYYVKPNKDVCKLQLPTLDKLPDDLLKQILPKFIENTLHHVNAVMACFVTEAFVSSAKSELTDEHKEILRDDSVSDEKKSKILLG